MRVAYEERREKQGRVRVASERILYRSRRRKIREDRGQEIQRTPHTTNTELCSWAFWVRTTATRFFTTTSSSKSRQTESRISGSMFNVIHILQTWYQRHPYWAHCKSNSIFYTKMHPRTFFSLFCTSVRKDASWATDLRPPRIRAGLARNHGGRELGGPATTQLP